MISKLFEISKFIDSSKRKEKNSPTQRQRTPYIYAIRRITEYTRAERELKLRNGA